MTATTLHFSPQPTRAARARWAFLEANLPFEGHAVDIFKGEHRTDSYLRVHPLAIVPAAVFEGEVVVESAALALIAASQQPQAGLLPELGTSGWRAALQWVVFAPAELDHLLATLNQHTRFLPPAQRDAAIAAKTVTAFGKRAAMIIDALGEGPFLLGEQFSVADICVGHSLVWATMIDQLSQYPALVAYVARLGQREAFRAVYGPEIPHFPDPHAG